MMETDKGYMYVGGYESREEAERELYELMRDE